MLIKNDDSNSGFDYHEVNNFLISRTYRLFARGKDCKKKWNAAKLDFLM